MYGRQITISVAVTLVVWACTPETDASQQLNPLDYEVVGTVYNSLFSTCEPAVFHELGTFSTGDSGKANLYGQSYLGDWYERNKASVLLESDKGAKVEVFNSIRLTDDSSLRVTDGRGVLFFSIPGFSLNKDTAYVEVEATCSGCEACGQSIGVIAGRDRQIEEWKIYEVIWMGEL